MSKKLNRFGTAALAAIMAASVLAGCGGDNSSSTADNSESGNTASEGSTVAEPTKEHLDITCYLWGDKPNQMDDVIAEFESRTADELNMSIDFNWAPQSDYTNNIKLKLSAGEEVDMCFDAPWMNMNTFIAQGNYRDLTSYFHNPEYPGLEAAFNEEFMSNNLMGENGDQVFGIPLTQSFGGGGMVYIRGDLREKYGLEPVTDLESFEAYLQAIVENEPSMIPFVMNGDGSYGALSIFDAQTPEKAIGKIEAGLWDVELASGVTATLYIQDYEVKDCVISGEPASASANFPAPYNTTDLSSYEAVRDWYEKGYIEKDVVTRQDAQATFTSGKGASFMWDVAQYNSVLSSLTQSVPDAKLETWNYDPLTTNDVKGMKKGAYTAWNFICIPITTSDEKTDRIMEFFDWMFSSTENHDLFEWGIEGTNFVAVGEDQYDYPEGLDLSTNYNFPGYELTWNPNFIRYPVGYPEDVLANMKNANNPEVYYDPMLSGFRFNSDPVKNQLANPDFATVQTRKNNLTLGIFDDVAAENAAIDEEVSNNKTLQEDIADIKEEVIKQAEVYLEKRKAQDEENGTVYPTVADLEAQLGE